ncbi:hypothetical protein F5Y16DRAFT_400356 [Xylariaceae sp. FL0255]|nr:hypothetical protein F5Y16DRAFT_400356 [Xylariaceae sp. FL0255]
MSNSSLSSDQSTKREVRVGIELEFPLTRPTHISSTKTLDLDHVTLEILQKVENDMHRRGFIQEDPPTNVLIEWIARRIEGLQLGVRRAQWEVEEDDYKSDETQSEQSGSQVLSLITIPEPALSDLPLYDEKKWTVGFDFTIQYNDHFNGYKGPAYGIEIDTPVFTFKDQQLAGFEDELSKVWDILQPLFISDLSLWINCSTQIHCSIGHEHNVFPIDIAQNVAFAAFFFEHAIDELMPFVSAKTKDKPYGWKSNRYAQPMEELIRLDHQKYPGIEMNLQGVWKTIRHTKHMGQLFKAFCSNDKYSKWNMYGNGFKTIEFRQPPPSRTVQEALDWAEFTCYFVDRARRIDPAQLDLAAEGSMSFERARCLSKGLDVFRKGS